MSISRFISLSLLFFIAVSLAAAEPKADPPVKLTLQGSSAPETLIRFLPTIREKTPGNAAIFAYRATHAAYRTDAAREAMKKLDENLSAWQKPEANQEEIAAWLKTVPTAVFNELRSAAYRERCEFEFRLQDASGPEAIGFLLGELQDFRSLSRYLSIKCRHEIGRKDFTAARETMLVHYRLAEIAATEPLLINRLVGIAIASRACADAERWIAEPGSPNIYWSLASLPRPLVDMRPAIEFEMGLPEQYFAILRDAKRADDQGIIALVNETTAQLKSLQGVNGQNENDWLANLTSAFAAAQAYPAAKKALVARGMKQEEVDKMSAGKILALHISHVTRRLCDETAKAGLVESQHQIAVSQRADEALKQAKTEEPIASIFAATLLPAVSRTQLSANRLTRDIAALQTIEAIRLHLAANGTLPNELAEIKEVPLPSDPFTGQPVSYSRNGMNIVIDLPSPEATSPQYAKRYEITFKSSDAPNEAEPKK